jgi:hypothetical protein
MLPKYEKPKSVTLPFCTMRGRHYVSRSGLEWFKRASVAIAMGEDVPPLPESPSGDALIPLKLVGAELGVGRRTVGRYIREPSATADAAE